MIQFVLSVTAIVAVMASEDPKEASQKELERLQGEWKMVSGLRNGNEIPAEAVSHMRCRVRGARVTFLREDKPVEEVTITLDPSKQPKVLDAKLADTQKVAPGIYQLEGDSFTLCYAPPRVSAADRVHCETGYRLLPFRLEARTEVIKAFSSSRRRVLRPSQSTANGSAD
jgi:uncharacterized protein (TIGR03067 family)